MYVEHKMFCVTNKMVQSFTQKRFKWRVLENVRDYNINVENHGLYMVIFCVYTCNLKLNMNSYCEMLSVLSM